VVGCARLAARAGPRPETSRSAGLVLEAGIWLVRSARGRGVGGAVLPLLVARAREHGAAVLVARTTPGNAAAQSALARLEGAWRGQEGDEVQVALDL
jgi:RimJ/RimL family protein N-acetyltransferase